MMTDSDSQLDAREGEAQEGVELEQGAAGEELARLVKDRDEWRDKAYRLAADAENSKRRVAQDVESARKFAVQSFARDMLPIADNLIRALQAPEGNEKALRDGVTMVAALLEQTFSRHGIAKVAVTTGAALDPNVHQAMTEVDAPESFTGSAGTIVGELQSGFTLNDRLLRPAMVSVAKVKGVA